MIFPKGMPGQHKRSQISSKQTLLIEQVTESGFFVDITLEFLQNNCQNEEDGKKEVDKLLVLCLDNLHVRSLGQIGNWCHSLQVCILPNNHLRSIAAFHGCIHLIKLDIHGNQLSSIPDEEFWSKMWHLEFLYLHDNPIASMDAVSRLAACPKLTALTMYDTPLSLMNKYRQLVVNGLIVLKALDHYIVADQEIIENLRATKRFAAFKLSLKIHLCPSSNQKMSSSAALKQVTIIRRYINHIMAHQSPVVIIQKFIRSYLTRLRLKKQPKTGLMVTTSSEPRPKMELQPYNLPTTLIAATVPKVARFHSQQAETSTNSSYFDFAPPQSLMSQELEELRSPKGRINQSKPPPFLLLNDILQQNNVTGDGINLQKTHSKNIPEEEKKTSQKNQINAIESKKSSKSSKSHLKTEGNFPLTFTGDEIPISNFCLQGIKKAVLSTDAFSELVLNHHDTGAAIRNMHAECHVSPDSNDNVTTIRKFRPKQAWAMNKRFQKRILKQVNMSRLFAIQQAYQDQQLTNQRKKRMEETQRRNTEHMLAQERCRISQEEKRCMMMQQQKVQKQRIHLGINQNAVKKTEYLEKQRELRNRSQLAHGRMEEDAWFMQEFDQRQFSISRALLKHDKQQLEEEVTLRKRISVEDLQHQLQWSREKIKNFQMQKIVARQTKNIKQNDKIRESFSQISVQKLKEAQMRVTQKKQGVKKQGVPYNLPLIIVNEHGNGKSKKINSPEQTVGNG